MLIDDRTIVLAQKKQKTKKDEKELKKCSLVLLFRVFAFIVVFAPNDHLPAVVVSDSVSELSELSASVVCGVGRAGEDWIDWTGDGLVCGGAGIRGDDRIPGGGGGGRGG